MGLSDVYHYAIKAVDQEIERLRAIRADILKEKEMAVGNKPEAVGPEQRLGQAKLGAPPAPPPGPKSRVVRECKSPAKKRGRPRKVRHAVCQADIVKVLEAKGPSTAFGIKDLLERELSIEVTEKRVKDVLESGEGSKFFPTDDGKWGLTL
jgi:hypothetical protein